MAHTALGLFRNQYAVGVVSGVFMCMLTLALFQFHTVPRISGTLQTTLRDISYIERSATKQEFPTDTVSSAQALQVSKNLTQPSNVIPEKVTTISSTTTSTTTTQAPIPSCISAKPSTRKPKTFSPLPLIDGVLPLITKNYQDDDTSVRDLLYRKVRVLCWVMTTPDGLMTKAIHSYKTWGHRCNKVLFFSSAENSSFPAPVIKVDIEEGRDHLTGKTMHAFKHIYDHYRNDYEWFMKTDDDTYVIPENLRYFLSDRNPKEPVYYGHHYKVIVPTQGYYGGGGGYVISKEALERFGTRGFYNHDFCREDGGAEDAEFGLCMKNLDVRTAETFDELGRSRFHGLDPGLHLHGQYPYWYYNIDSHGAKHGADSISNYPISFHYMTPEAMYDYTFYVYHLRVYGVTDRSRPELHSYYTSEIS
ncbi:glycoprotein-N-acetylgalactosamine 3-beta-galactosyltransferase 1-like [Watersipora subatra]|uniref:glycoprotein-N-acetylgalactosamine 3-beta-galactosyltransferase 1-like n=1 Tax=Watersipora subatra TaxID=2589382 RepID=UPI00355B05D5